METITYDQVQQLVEKLPETKLPLVYHFLVELVGKEGNLSRLKQISCDFHQKNGTNFYPNKRKK